MFVQSAKSRMVKRIHCVRRWRAREEEREQREIEGRQQEEAVVTDAIEKAPQVGGEGFVAIAVDDRLGAVIEILFGRERAVRNGIRLEGEGGGDAVFVAAQHIGQREPLVRHGFVLQQREADGGEYGQRCKDQGAPGPQFDEWHIRTRMRIETTGWIRRGA